MRNYIYEPELIKILQAVKGDVKKSENQYCVYDCYNEDALFELKCRRANYNEYVIEKHKYDSLLEEANKQDKEVYYVVSDLDNIYIYDLKKVNVNWRMQKAPTKTDFAGSKRTTRLQGFIDTKEAKLLISSNNYKAILEFKK